MNKIPKRPPSTGILVLAMHRSGASALSRVMNLRGATTAHQLMETSRGNEAGHWQSLAVYDAHERLLAALGRRWNDVREMPPGWQEHPEAQRAAKTIRQFVLDELASEALWSIKDPRLCRLLPLWTAALADLPVRLTAVFAFRHPLEVAASLAKRDGLDRGDAILLWMQHMVEAERASRDLPRSAVYYPDLLADWRGTTERLATELGFQWPRDSEEIAAQVEKFIAPDMRHHDAASGTSAESRLSPLVRTMFEAALHARSDGSAWRELADTSERASAAAALYGPCLDEAFARGALAEQRARAAETVVTRGPADPDFLGREADLVSAARDGSYAALEKLNQIGPLPTELVAQVAAQRRQLGETHSSEKGQPCTAAEQSGPKMRALEQQRDELAAALAERNAYISALLQSSSWRLTAPLRAISLMLSRQGRTHTAHALGRYLRTFYLRLPIPWALRLRIKDLVFRTFAPLLRRTNAYRRWDAFRNGRLTTAAGDKPLDGSSRSAQALMAHAPDPTQYVELDDEALDPDALKAKLIAFYLPQFHPIPENDAWWGRGFTEWTNVTKALPQFEGHYQPRLPGELGFYDLRVPEVMRRQIELARHYGVHGFCFHYYWFDGRRLLERPLEQFLADPSLDFPFCLCWANENWTRRWDGADHEILIGQEHTPESDMRFIEDAATYLRDPRYIRLNGRPLLMVYRPSLLPSAKSTLHRWRAYCRETGIGELFMVMAQFDGEDPRPFGFDAAVEFPPHKLAADLQPINHTLDMLNPAFAGHVIEYEAIVEQAKAWPDSDFDLIRGVFPSWDNEARKPGRGYLFAHSTPERYRGWLSFAVDYARAHPVEGEPLVFVNAWNEWAEGAYLEPDRRYGYAYLRATRDALTGYHGVLEPWSEASRPRVVVVSHDAHPHGAQYLALHLARELDTLGCEVAIVLLGDGALLPEFDSVSSVHQLSDVDTAARKALARRLFQSGYRQAIANTTVSGLFVSDLAEAGMTVVSLIHELPGVLKSYGLSEHARSIAKHAQRVVFAAEPVQSGFEALAPLASGQALIRPQGLYKRNSYRGRPDPASARARLRERIAVPTFARIVLGVGYADHRKGIDLFIRAGELVMQASADAHFLWLGHFDLTLETRIRAQVAATGFADRFHFPGRQSDTDLYYAGSDVLALTSREDPFPTVIMEALDVAVPVVAFRDAGGFEGLLERAGGSLVSHGDAEAMADAISGWLRDDEVRRAAGQRGKSVIDAEFSFRRYVFDLLKYTGLDLPRVSVVVPNYNYGRLLRERLHSIEAQTVKPYEIILLDDASSDDSAEIIAGLQYEYDLRVVRNTANSGSAFRQWLKGAELAQGDYVWIAEADDLSEPDFLETALRGFSDPDVVLSYTESKQMGANGEILALHYRDYLADLDAARWEAPFVGNGDTEIADYLAVKNTIPNVSAAVFRREPLLQVLNENIEEIAGFRIAGDWDVYTRLLPGKKLAFDPAPLNLHRRHEAGLTMGSDNLPHLREVMRMQALVRERHSISPNAALKAEHYITMLREHFQLPTDAR